MLQSHLLTASELPSCVDPGGAGGGGAMCPDPPLKNKNIGFLCNTGPDPLKNHKAVGPSSARQ